MDRRPGTRGGARKNNSRLKTLLWIGGMAVITISLIYFEQTALLYVLATLGVTVLLVLVALADLSGAQREGGASALGDDAAAIGSGITGATAPAVSSPATAAATARRASRAKRR